MSLQSQTSRSALRSEKQIPFGFAQGRLRLRALTGAPLRMTDIDLGRLRRGND